MPSTRKYHPNDLLDAQNSEHFVRSAKRQAASTHPDLLPAHGPEYYAPRRRRKRQATSGKLQAASSKQQAQSNKRQAASHKRQAS